MRMQTQAYSRNAGYGGQVHVGGETPATKEECPRHLDLVKYIALRLTPRLPADISVDDLFNSGIIGLMDAIDKFDPSQEIQFKTYAKITSRCHAGRTRAMDWVPRSLRQKSNRLQTTSRPGTKAWPQPTDEEVATDLEISSTNISNFSMKSSVSVLPIEILEALQESQGDKQLGVSSRIPSSIFHAEVRAKLAEAIRSLSKNEQLVLSLYYYEELVEEIGLIHTESHLADPHQGHPAFAHSPCRSFNKEDLLDFS